MSALVTRDPFRWTHTAVLCHAKEPPAALRKAFRKLYAQGRDGDDLIDLANAARAHGKAGEFRPAAYMLAKCVRLDPESPEILHDFIEASIAGGFARPLIKHCRRGLELDRERRFDFDNQLGRVLLRLDRPGEARQAFARSLERDPENPRTLALLAEAYDALREHKQAYVIFRKVLELQPDGPIAERIRRKLTDGYMPRDVTNLSFQAGAGSWARPRPES